MPTNSAIAAQGTAGALSRLRLEVMRNVTDLVKMPIVTVGPRLVALDTSLNVVDSPLSVLLLGLPLLVAVAAVLLKVGHAKSTNASTIDDEAESLFITNTLPKSVCATEVVSGS